MYFLNSVEKSVVVDTRRYASLLSLSLHDVNFIFEHCAVYYYFRRERDEIY